MSLVEVVLAEGEELLGDGDEHVYRQICGHMYDDEKLTSRAFGTATADDGKPSYTRSSATTAQEARDWHNRHANARSLAVMALAVAEVVGTGRVAIDDSRTALRTDEVRPNGHCYIDFRNLTRAQRRDISAQLLRFALRRGPIPTADRLEQPMVFDEA